MAKKTKPAPAEIQAPVRRLSVLRLFVALLVTFGLVGGGFAGWQYYTAQASSPAVGSWFAGYVDVTATPSFAFETPAVSAGKQVVLSFVVASKADPCAPSWGGSYSLDEASASLDLDRRIARLQDAGGVVAASFGGQKNSELATTCTSVSKLAQAYLDVIDRYKLSTIDLDIEGPALLDSQANDRRAEALARVQQQRRSDGHPLAVWLTLPVTSTGLAVEGQQAVTATLDQKVDIAGVNAMTMDYGSSLPHDMTVLTASEDALTALQRQLGVLYLRDKISLTPSTLWSKVGATPMIGQNDVPGEIFTLSDAAKLNQFAKAHGVGRLSMWSLNRDLACGSNYTNLAVESDSCSGLKQGTQHFASVISRGITGSVDANAKSVTHAQKVSTKVVKDDPKTSPYPIWSVTDSYLQGTKIVWHHNVYLAKWWNEGDLPDNPVLNSWETPWQFIGPVLPGEKPIKPVTVPAGTFPNWDGTKVYNKGDEIEFDGLPYQAKWWTQGDSPAETSSNPDASPWVPLTVAQINAINEKLKAAGK